MTALGVLRLVESGAIQLTDPVRPILGDDLPLIDDAVTIEHLLGHTSGIGDYLDEEADWEPTDYILPVPVHTLADTEAFVPWSTASPRPSRPASGSPTTTAATSCSRVIIDRLSDVGYHAYVEQEVCARAGLTGTDLPALRRAARRRRAGLPVRRRQPDQRAAPAGPRERRRRHLLGRGRPAPFWQSLVAGRIVGPDLVADHDHPAARRARRRTALRPRLLAAPHRPTRSWSRATTPESRCARSTIRRPGSRRPCWPTPPKAPGEWPASCWHSSPEPTASRQSLQPTRWISITSAVGGSGRRATGRSR